MGVKEKDDLWWKQVMRRFVLGKGDTALLMHLVRFVKAVSQKALFPRCPRYLSLNYNESRNMQLVIKLPAQIQPHRFPQRATQTSAPTFLCRVHFEQCCSCCSSQWNDHGSMLKCAGSGKGFIIFFFMQHCHAGFSISSGRLSGDAEVLSKAEGQH